MTQEYDNKVIRDIIDKSFDAGFEEGVRKSIECLRSNFWNYYDNETNYFNFSGLQYKLMGEVKK